MSVIVPTQTVFYPPVHSPRLVNATFGCGQPVLFPGQLFLRGEEDVREGWLQLPLILLLGDDLL